MMRAAAGSLLLLLYLIFNFAAVGAADSTCNATDTNMEQDGVRGSVLLQHQKVLPNAVGEALDAFEADFHNGGVEMPEEETPEHVGGEVLSFVESAESRVAQEGQTGLKPFTNHWLTLADKRLKTAGTKTIYKSVDGKGETWGAGPVWQVDLGTSYDIEQIKINWRICKCVLEGSLIFEGSVDGVYWHRFWSNTKHMGSFYAWGSKSGTYDALYNMHFHGRHFRIRTTEVSPVQWVSMYEVNFYGRMSGARSDVYGWYESYQAGTLSRGGGNLGGTEIVHLEVHKGKLFGGVGYWMNNGAYRAAEVVRLDCSFCGWAVDGAPNPYAGRIESLKSVRWTTDRNGDLLDPPVEALYASYSLKWQQGGRVYVANRLDDTRTWAEEVVFSGSWKENYFAARAMVLHRDKVTNVDRLFVSTGMGGIISGTLAGPWGSDVDWKNHWEKHPTETGPLPTRPLGMAVFAGSLYVSTSSYIMRRSDGPSPTWSKVFDMAVFDNETVDEAVGGIRGLSSIGNSMLFCWAPKADAEKLGCMVRLDPDGEGFTHHYESCVRELVSNYLGNDLYGRPAIVPFTIAAYNGVLAMPSSGGEEPKHIIGFQIQLWGYSTAQFPIDTDQLAYTSSGKRLAYYAGAGFLIRHSADHYEVRQPGGPRYDPNDIYPKKTAVRAYAISPFEGDDGVVFMGGYDCNHFPSQNTAWVMRGERSAVFEEPVPCLKERGCGHVPGEPFKRLGCDLCSGRPFLGEETASWFQNGEPMTCQWVMDWLNNKAPDSKCQTFKTLPVARKCCGDCNFCLGTGKHFVPENVVGTAQGRTYTCADAYSYVQQGYWSCYQGTVWWKNMCCGS